jgi:hypothetical protein
MPGDRDTTSMRFNPRFSTSEFWLYVRPPRYLRRIPVFRQRERFSEAHMMARGKQFDVTIQRIEAPIELEWPSEKELESDTLGGNQSYIEIEVAGWSDVGAFIEEERLIIESLHAHDDVAAAHDEWMEEDYEDPTLYGFDLGTNALTAALSAARCLPFYGCNAGAFGGDHNDSYPLVSFFCREEIFPFVDSAAQRSGAGLEYNHAGGITAFGQNVETLIMMASALHDLRSEIDAVRVGPTHFGGP